MLTRRELLLGATAMAGAAVVPALPDRDAGPVFVGFDVGSDDMTIAVHMRRLDDGTFELIG